jgi:hypothetical protein
VKPRARPKARLLQTVRTRAAPLNLNAEFEADLRDREGGRGMDLLLRLVAEHSIWVGPRVARAVPVVFPKTARSVPGSGKIGRVEGGVRKWANQPAQEAIFDAMGSNQNEWRGQVVCHVYPLSPYNPQHYTRLANLFIVPESLSSFTEWGPVLEALKRHAYYLYGYKGPDGATPFSSGRALPWSRPVELTAGEERRVIAKLKHMRRTRPMYSTPGGGHPRESRPSIKRKNARRIEEEFWAACEANAPTMEEFVGWFARHTRFAPRAAVEAVPNPFPKVRRMRRGRGEKLGDIVDGIAVADNRPARFALLAALGYSGQATRGGLVDHLWKGAAYLPAHNAHLAGLVLVPTALGTFVDAPPMRGMLQRRTFERTGYRGPGGRAPPRSPWAPQDWPELVFQTPAQQSRALSRLRRYRSTRPGYFTGRHPRRRGSSR